jgi:transcriptional regulator with XRE-family HTH domain
MKHPTLDDLLARIDGTWDEVAQELNISQRTLYNVRHGRHRPNRATLLMIANNLRVKPEVVLKAIEAAKRR